MSSAFLPASVDRRPGEPGDGLAPIIVADIATLRDCERAAPPFRSVAQPWSNRSLRESRVAEITVLQ